MHLDVQIPVPVAVDIKARAETVYESDGPPELFWRLQTSANPIGLGEKVSPVPCGDVLRRIIGGTFCREYSASLRDFFRRLGQCELTVKKGVEIVAEQATTHLQRGALS